MTKSLYSAGVSADMQSGGTVVATCAIVAASKEQAIGFAIIYAKERWAHGYSNHQVTVFKIPQYLIDAVNSEGDNA